MGQPSCQEDNIRKAEEAAFMDRAMAPDLARILAAPVSKNSRIKSAKLSAGECEKLDRLGKKVGSQQNEIAQLKAQNVNLRKALEAEKLHVTQLRVRLDEATGPLLTGVEKRRLETEIAKRDKEILELRQLVMRGQIG
jgi:predicted RNase H-like nuclease (RuvC/YqgF family)